MPTVRIAYFDLWQPGYGGDTVRVVRAGTNDDAPIFEDEALTEAADNPQTLLSLVQNDIPYGKWAQPIYVAVPYELVINSVDRTGVARPPLNTLDGEDASDALVTVRDGERAIRLQDHLVRRIDVRDYGEFIPVGSPGASAGTNNATLVAAMGVAAAQGGGFVEIPGGTYAVRFFSIPQGVVIRGQGRAATTLQSDTAGQVAIIGGARAGLSRLTLDGLTLIGNSVGIYAEGRDEIVLDDVEVKRLETGIHRKGGSRCNWREVVISNCVNGYKAHGDAALGNGGALSFDRWLGGKVELCTTVGVELKYVDELCEHQWIEGITFDTNTGTAIRIIGARHFAFVGCDFTGNTVDIDISDASPVTSDNTVLGAEFTDGKISGGTITLTGAVRAVAFRRMDMSFVTVTLTTPEHNVLVEDCREFGVTLAGNTTTAWSRHRTFDQGSSKVGTGNNIPTKAWAITLEPAQFVHLEGKVIGRAINNGKHAMFHFVALCNRNGADLNYDTQTENFTLGDILTGQTSGATARLITDTDAGTSGTLRLQDITGDYVDNEIITGSLGGSATANGTLSVPTTNLLSAVTNLATPAGSGIAAGWAATFVANGPEIELRVTGDNTSTVEWIADVQVVSFGEAA